MDTQGIPTLTINGIVVDFERETMCDRAGNSIDLRPQSFAVLRLLAENANRVVTKDELIQSIWRGLAVTDDSIVQCIHEIRRALHDESQAILKTVPKRGYRLMISADAGSTAGGLNSRSFFLSGLFLSLVIATVLAWWLLERPQPLRDRTPVVAVLPFDDMSPERNLRYLGDGLAEDLISMLASAPDISVIARNSSFTFGRSPVDVRKVGVELGADFVLEGSVRREGDRLRLVAQLNDAKTGQHLWAQRFDELESDPWKLQDKVAGKIIASITGEVGKIKQAQFGEVWRKDATSLDEYDYYLRGLDIFVNAGDRSALDRSRKVWVEGLSKFPNSALLQIKLAWNYHKSAYYGFSESPNEDFAHSARLVRKAMAQDNLTPLELRTGHWLLALVLSQERDFAGAVREAQAAISLAPNDARMFGDLSEVLTMAGNPLQAIEILNKAIALDPRSNSNLHLSKAWALQVAGKPAESVAVYESQSFAAPMAYLTMAISLARVGRHEEAKSMVSKALVIQPSFTQARWRDLSYYADTKITDGEIADLARIGLPLQ
ncbi:MAG: winged helix-turn-helix domain-containing protein [Phyllobacterium sp.]|uniref:winged helix-turn-helix domain-containing protein n=1 Tax=Phyllobacterium sp. TaxID=1871046 RepID=UPI0030F12EB0